jgi:peroxiredoxin
MGTIKAGDTLSNYAFEDIDGNLHLPSEIVTDKTLITYLKPDCDACLEEMERLRQAAESQDDYDHVLLIASANPLHLHRLREDYGLGCLILYDDERLFGSTLRISSFPFNLVVDRSRVILEIHANTLLLDDYERFFEDARASAGQTLGAILPVGWGTGEDTRASVGQTLGAIPPVGWGTGFALGEIPPVGLGIGCWGTGFAADNVDAAAFSVTSAPLYVTPAQAGAQSCTTGRRNLMYELKT